MGGNIHKKKKAGNAGGERKTWKIRARGPLGHTPESAIRNKLKKDLFDAAKKGDTKKVEELIEKGADVNVEDGTGWTPLIYAAAQGHSEIVELLIEKEADVYARNGIGATSLMYAAAAGHVETVELLIEKGADVNAKNDFGGTALSMCRANSPPNKTKIIKILRENGAKVRPPKVR